MKLGARSPLPFPRGSEGGAIRTTNNSTISFESISMWTDVICYFPQACMWLDLLNVIQGCFFSKNLQFSLADCYGLFKGSWVVWQWFCSHTYGVNGGLTLCLHAQTRHTQYNSALWMFNFAVTFFYLASDKYRLFREHSIGQTLESTFSYGKLYKFGEGSLQACWSCALFRQHFRTISSGLGWEMLDKTAGSLTFLQVQRDLLCGQKSHLFNRIFNCRSLQIKPSVWLVCVLTWVLFHIWERVWSSIAPVWLASYSPSAHAVIPLL